MTSRIGIVFAVRDEARWLEALLASVKAQEGLDTVARIVAVDGLSQDGSRAILDRWQKTDLPRLSVLANDAKIAPVGFNIGIRACLEAGCDAILIISAHSALHEGFLVQVQRILSTSDAAIVGCVLDYPRPESAFEKASQAFVESRLGRRLAAYSTLADLTDTEIATFPVVRREVFERVGLFDESMARNQDIEFTARARAAGFRVATSPRLRCRYSPPASLGRLVRQMYGNGLWVGRRLDAHGIRHFAPALFFGVAILAGCAAGFAGGGYIWAFASLAAVYLLSVLAVSLAWVPKAGSGALWLPVAFISAHAAYAVGTFLGLLTRTGGSASRTAT